MTGALNAKMATIMQPPKPTVVAPQEMLLNGAGDSPAVPERDVVYPPASTINNLHVKEESRDTSVPTIPLPVVQTTR